MSVLFCFHMLGKFMAVIFSISPLALSVFIFSNPYNGNVGTFKVFPEVLEIVLIFFFIFVLFILFHSNDFHHSFFSLFILLHALIYYLYLL